MKRAFVGLVLLVLALGLVGCGVTIKAEGCYYEPPYGRVCVSATRDAEGKIVVEVRADVGELGPLPPDVLGRAVQYGETLVKKPPGD